MYNRIFTIPVLGTGALITVKTGFRPKRVKVINNTLVASLEWVEGMGNGCAYKILVAPATTYIVTAGITPTDSGFTIGTDAVNVTSSIIATTMTGTKGSAVLTVASATGLLVGQYLVGVGLPYTSPDGTSAGFAKIVSLASTAVTIDKPLSADITAGTAVKVANLIIQAEV